MPPARRKTDPDKGPFLDSGPSSSPYRQKARRTPLEKELLELLEKAPLPECPACRAMYAVDMKTKKAWPLTCRRWTCPACVRRNSLLATEIVLYGLEAAHSAGNHAAHLTVTDERGLAVPEMVNRWQKRLKPRLVRREVFGDSYVSALGRNPDTGHVHLHVVSIGWKFLPQGLIAEQARLSGLGSRHLAIKRVKPSNRDRERLATYLGENLLEYAQSVRPARRKRLRPFNPSREWPGGLLTRPAWRQQADEGRSFAIAGFTAEGVPWVRPATKKDG